MTLPFTGQSLAGSVTCAMPIVMLPFDLCHDYFQPVPAISHPTERARLLILIHKEY